jgi:TLD
MPNKRCHASLLHAIVLVIVNFHGSSEGYDVGSHKYLSIRSRHFARNNNIENVEQQRQRHKNNEYWLDESMRMPICLSMTIEPTDYINNLAYNGVVAQETIPIAIGTATAMALFLLMPPSRLISTGDLNSIVMGTYLEQKRNQLRCVYKASKDGWSAIAFHDAVDDKGSGIVVARTITGTTFGGFNPNGWRSTDDYYSSSAAFLWCFGSGKKIVKLPILPGGNCAVFDYATSGPCFGAADLIIGPPQAAIMGGFAGPDAEDISKSAGSLRQCKSSVGATYDYDRAWPIRGSARLSEVEVYCLTNSK